MSDQQKNKKSPGRKRREIDWLNTEVGTIDQLLIDLIERVEKLESDIEKLESDNG